MKSGTRVIHAGNTEGQPGEPFSGAVTFAAPFYAAGEVLDSPYTYGRYHNPTWTRYEQALADLEGGYALCFASGMAAIAAVLGTTLRPADILVMPSDSYYTARLLADGFLTEMGIEVRQTSTAGNGFPELLDGARLLWLESPVNPGLDVCDLRELSRLAHEKGVLVAVDNTTATILGQSPLELGADFSVASDTKGLTGHSDLVLGHAAVKDAELHQKLNNWRTQMGAVPGPMEVWLAHRSLATLEMRLERQQQNCLQAAEYLLTNRQVTRLRYPGLPSDPAFAIAIRQMQYFGSVISFVLDSKEKADKFLRSCRLIIEATSFGGVQTTAERRARWGGDKIEAGFIRLSVGCENAADIIADLKQALDEIE